MSLLLIARAKSKSQGVSRHPATKLSQKAPLEPKPQDPKGDVAISCSLKWPPAEPFCPLPRAGRASGQPLQHSAAALFRDWGAISEALESSQQGLQVLVPPRGTDTANSWAPPSWLATLKGTPKNRLLQSPWPETLLTQITLAQRREEENTVICTETRTEPTEE